MSDSESIQPVLQKEIKFKQKSRKNIRSRKSSSSSDTQLDEDIILK